MKKILSVAVAAFLALTLAPAAFAEESESAKNAREIIEIFEISTKMEIFPEENRGNWYALLDYLTEAMEKDPELFDRLKGIWKDSVDVYSNVFDPGYDDEYTSSKKINNTGLAMGVKDGTLFVSSTAENSPAKAAGVIKGSEIVAIGGVPITGDVITDATAYGASVTENGFVDLTLKLPSGEVKTYHLVPADYDSDAAIEVCEIKGDTGYIKSTGFYSDTSERFAKAWKAAETAGVKSVIIDMRDNGGGIIDECYRMLNMVVPDVLPLSFYVENNEINCMTATGAGSKTWRPDIVILTNGNSASAAEMFTTALTTAGYARTVGTRSFGKGIGQSLEPLTSGNSLHITSLVYYTPDGKTYNRVGLTPDVKVIDDPMTAADEVLEYAYGYVDGEGTVREDVDAYRFTYRLRNDFEPININQILWVKNDPDLTGKQVVFSFMSGNGMKMNVDMRKAYDAAKLSFLFGIDSESSAKITEEYRNSGASEATAIVTAQKGDFGFSPTISLKTPAEPAHFYRCENETLTEFTPAYTYADGVLRFNIDKGGTFIVSPDEIK
ncbi:MAG: hypothetical protein LBM59_07080 [Ruminococcus sp.]|jgi:carboxyl-terminal processing protease|nr:hypothetical protein [Ruminococcus sp.]